MMNGKRKEGGRSRNFRIAALLPAEPEYSGRLLEGAIAYAQETDGVELIDHCYVRSRRAPVAKHDPLDFDGALVWLRPQDKWVRNLIERGVVVVNANGDWPPEVVPMVAFDGDSVVDEAVGHLAGLGRSQAAYIGGGISESAVLSRRVKRFTAQCQQAGMTTQVLELGIGKGIEDRMVRLNRSEQQALDLFLKSLGQASVLWCDSDHVARHVCDAAARLGLKLPDDLAVLGLGDYRIARMSRPTISSIPQPGQEIARRAVQWIHESLRGGVPCRGSIGLPSPQALVRESTSRPESDEQCYQLAMKWIEKHATAGLTVSQLMESMPFSQRTFSQRFAELYGRTPGAEIRRVRVERAKDYLRSTTLGVERIASLCGFDQSGKFSTFFKREAGMTPSIYRSGRKG